MRLGLFGGTFDPIHLGHLIAAEACREAIRLDRVWFVVAGEPPHKLQNRTTMAHRLEMARIAVAGNPAFEVCDIEARRPGPHYSVETVEAVQRDRPEDRLFFLIGSDSLADLPYWRQPERLLALATLIVVNRPGFDASADQLPVHLRSQAQTIERVTIPPIGIASHEIRQRVSQGRSIRYQVPRGVEAYIEAQGLYRQASGQVPSPAREQTEAGSSPGSPAADS
jgi:nicotinate-nucleotide adenylyltransferase